jgi:hypothetical protein
MKAKGSLPCSQEPATGACEHSSRPATRFPYPVKINTQILAPLSVLRVPSISSFLIWLSQ